MDIDATSFEGCQEFRRGAGVGNKPGDLYVILQISLPPAATDRAKEIYRNMQEELDFNPRARLGV